MDGAPRTTVETKDALSGAGFTALSRNWILQRSWNRKAEAGNRKAGAGLVGAMFMNASPLADVLFSKHNRLPANGTLPRVVAEEGKDF